MATLDQELKRLLDFGHLQKNVKDHLKNVYSTLTITLLAAAAGSYVHVCTAFLQGGLLSALGGLGLLFLLKSTPHTAENVSKRMAYLTGFGFLSGLGLGPLLDAVIRIDPSIIVTAFMGTAVIFACFSLAALYSTDKKFLFLGGMLMSGLSWMLMLSLFNIFFRSNMLFQVELYIGFAVMCGFVLYDTQLIVEKRTRGDDDYIWHCVDLFIDLVGIFRRLLIILAQKEDNKKKRRN